MDAPLQAIDQGHCSPGPQRHRLILSWDLWIQSLSTARLLSQRANERMDTLVCPMLASCPPGYLSSSLLQGFCRINSWHRLTSHLCSCEGYKKLISWHTRSYEALCQCTIPPSNSSFADPHTDEDQNKRNWEANRLAYNTLMYLCCIKHVQIVHADRAVDVIRNALLDLC